MAHPKLINEDGGRALLEDGGLLLLEDAFLILQEDSFEIELEESDGDDWLLMEETVFVPSANITAR